jgi:biopolymer transport protein ExbB
VHVVSCRLRWSAGLHFNEDDTVSPFVKFLTEDWYFAIPMILMSLTALTLVFWRIFLNMNAKTDMGQFLPVFQQKLEREGIESALRYCRAQQGLIPRRLFVAGLETSKQGLAAMRRAMANAIELDIVPDLNFLLPPILAIAKIATMVGLLGTVISMTNTFNEIQKAETGVTSHAGAIGLALYATALGLVTAIPLVFAHVLFKAWIAQFEVKMKNAAQKLLVLVQAVRPATGQPHTQLKPVAMEPAATSPRK